jgi:hypothetical protein
MTSRAAGQTPPEHLAWEAKQYTDETIAFIRREIRYATHMALAFQDGTLGEELFNRTIAAYLKAAEECLDLANSPLLAAEPEFLRIHLEAFPRIVGNLTTALLQRKQKQFPRPFSPPVLQAVFAPSEISLEYPLTIRAAEAVSGDYHGRVAKFFEKFPGCAPPLVNISGGAAANLSLPQVKFISGPDKSLSVERLLNLSCITLPRWSPQHIRTFAVAGHEHIHRVLQVCELAMTDISEVAKRERLRLAELIKRQIGQVIHSDSTELQSGAPELKFYLTLCNRFKDAYGDSIIELHKVQIYLQHVIKKFLSDQNFPQVTVRQVSQHVDHQVVEAFQDAIALHHANEFIADVGGTIIAGPASVRSFVTISNLDDTAYINELSSVDARRFSLSQHPPPAIRALLQVRVLRKLGFVSSARYVFQSIRPTLERAFAEESGGPLLVKYGNHFATPEMNWIVEKLIAIFSDVADHNNLRASYNLRRRGDSEGVVVQAWLARAAAVEERNLFLTEDLNGVYPADLINAIWEKRRSHGEVHPKNRLAWRFALRNAVGGVQ